MRKVKEILYEKFTEETTDIIKDMGIGDPELLKVYESLDIINDMAGGEITGSFSIKKSFTHVTNLYKLIYLAVKYHIDEKFNLDLRLDIKQLEYARGVAFASARAGNYQFSFKINDDTNEAYITLSFIRGAMRKHVETSSRCKTLDQLDRQMERFIKKYDIKITP